MLRQSGADQNSFRQMNVIVCAYEKIQLGLK